MFYLLEGNTVINSKKITEGKSFSCGELVTGFEENEGVLYYLKHDKKCRVGKILKKSEKVIDVLNETSKIKFKDGSVKKVYMLDGVPTFQVITQDNDGDYVIKFRKVSVAVKNKEVQSYIL